MQLRSARLCLDCEELHEEAQCPACASEAFVFLTRWVPVDERRKRRRSVRAPAPPPRVSRLVKGGAVGLALLATARLLWPTQSSTSNGPRREEDGPADPR